MELALPEGVNYEDHDNGLRFVVVNHPCAAARVCLQGAQVTHFQPAQGPEVFWVSEAEPYEPGKAIRGGIPLCWPWFGAHPSDTAAPAHGLARDAMWTLQSVSRRVDGVTLVLQLPELNTPHIPTGVELQLQIDVGAELLLRLTTTNNGVSDFNFSQALHAYFNIADINLAQVSGLAGVQYDDSLLPQASGDQRALMDQLKFDAEVDRIYYPRRPLAVESPVCRVELITEGSGSAVIWNPWIEKSKRLSHFLAQDYQRMVCVETANCGRDSRTLVAGASHSLSVTYVVDGTGKI